MINKGHTQLTVKRAQKVHTTMSTGLPVLATGACVRVQFTKMRACNIRVIFRHAWIERHAG